MSFACLTSLYYCADEEIGGHLGMKLFVKSEKFKNLNIGFCLDEGLEFAVAGKLSAMHITVNCIPPMFYFDVLLHF